MKTTAVSISNSTPLPRWATEFARELRRDEDGYTVVNNLGEGQYESLEREFANIEARFA